MHGEGNFGRYRDAAKPAGRRTTGRQVADGGGSATLLDNAPREHDAPAHTYQAPRINTPYGKGVAIFTNDQAFARSRRHGDGTPYLAIAGAFGEGHMTASTFFQYHVAPAPLAGRQLRYTLS